jgi:XTP/dITP diphosphohydrolase
VKPLLVATRNPGKLREIESILGPGVPLRYLVDYPEAHDVEEDGDTFEANALKKATEMCAVTGLITLADDSGLEVDALNGAPGVYSARFAGPEATDDDNNAKLLDLLKHTPDNERQARFRCVIAIVSPEGNAKTVSDAWEGSIIHEARGENGFGYDPLFFSPEDGTTSAELAPETKNRASHRGKALRAGKPLILEFLED